MDKLARALQFAAGVVLVGLLINLVSDDLGAWLRGHPVRLTMAAAISITLILLAWHVTRLAGRERLQGEFDLYTTSEALEPEDVGFKTAVPGDAVSQPRRPYYATYIVRTAVPYADRHRDEPDVVYREDELVAMLVRGESLLLVGVPTEGKTRTLYELVKRTSGCVVVRPKRERSPSDEALALLAGKRVICLLDDINSYAGTPVDLHDFRRRIADCAASCVVAGATRDGPELDAVQLRTTPLHQLYESIRQKLWLRRASDRDKQALSQAVRAGGNHAATTLGSICMSGAYDLMAARFDAFPDGVKDCHRAIQLLAAGGVEPFTHERIGEVVARVFQRSLGPAPLRDHLATMAAQGFLFSAPEVDPVRPEMAYVAGPAARRFYFADRVVDVDVPQLADALFALGDGSGLLDIATTFYLSGDKRAALTHNSLVEQLSEQHDVDARVRAHALYNSGVVLNELDRAEESIATYDALIARYGHALDAALLEPVSRAVFAKGATLSELGRSEEAIAAYDELIASKGHVTEAASRKSVAIALVIKGIAFGQLGRSEDAIAAYDVLIAREGQALETALREQVGKALINKGVMLGGLGRPEDEIAVYDELIARESNAPETTLRKLVARALVNKGIALDQLGNADDAIAAYDLLITRDHEAPETELRELVASALVSKSETLGRLGRFEHAIAVYDELIVRDGQALDAALCERVAIALFKKGAALDRLGRAEDAIVTYDVLVARQDRAPETALRELAAKALLNKGATLDRLGRTEDAIMVYSELVARHDRAPEMALRELVAAALFNKGATLGQLGRFEDEIIAYDELIAREGLAPEVALRGQVAEAYINKGATLGQLGRSDDAISAFDELIARDGQAPEVVLRGQVAKALVNKGATLSQTARSDAAIAVFDELIAREGQAPEVMLREHVARALFYKGVTLGQLARLEEQAAAYDELVAREGETQEPIVREMVAKAQMSKWIAQRLGGGPAVA